MQGSKGLHFRWLTLVMILNGTFLMDWINGMQKYIAHNWNHLLNEVWMDFVSSVHVSSWINLILCVWGSEQTLTWTFEEYQYSTSRKSCKKKWKKAFYIQKFRCHSILPICCLHVILQWNQTPAVPGFQSESISNFLLRCDSGNLGIEFQFHNKWDKNSKKTDHTDRVQLHILNQSFQQPSCHFKEIMQLHVCQECNLL